MPVHPSEENDNAGPGSITESVMKNPSSNTESKASDHERHHNENEPKTKPTAQDFHSPGPVKADSMPEKASREETEAKMKAMNQ